MTLKPFADLKSAEGDTHDWMSRRSFSQLLTGLIAASGLTIKPSLASTQTPTGLYLKAAPVAEEELPFDFHFTASDRGSVRPGVVFAAGSHEGFVLESDEIVTPTRGFIAVRCKWNLPLWSVVQGTFTSWRMAGWVELVELPSLGFITAPEAMSIHYDRYPQYLDGPVPVTYPVAFVDPANQVVHRLCNVPIYLAPWRTAGVSGEPTATVQPARKP